MPWGLHRYQQTRDIHLITFSCYKRQQRFQTALAFNTFERSLERVRRWYGLTINAYVVMPEHVHLLVHEPERSTLSVAIQMLKLMVGRELSTDDGTPFWQRRYHDRNIYSAKAYTAALQYIHQPGDTRTVRTATRLALEQLHALPDRSRRRGRD